MTVKSLRSYKYHRGYYRHKKNIKNRHEQPRLGEIFSTVIFLKLLHLHRGLEFNQRPVRLYDTGHFNTMFQAGNKAAKICYYISPSKRYFKYWEPWVSGVLCPCNRFQQAPKKQPKLERSHTERLDRTDFQNPEGYN